MYNKNFLINQKFNKIMSKVNQIKSSLISKSFTTNYNISTPNKLQHIKHYKTINSPTSSLSSPTSSSITIPIPISSNHILYNTCIKNNNSNTNTNTNSNNN
jgi:hypothetical protein